MPERKVKTPQRGRRAPSVGVLVAQFAIAGLAGVVLLGVLGVALLRQTATDAATRDAKQVTRLAGEGIVAPNVSNGVMRGDRSAVKALDDVVRQRVLDPSVVRVKLWTPQGRIVYSDDRRLIGTTYPLPADLRKSLREGGVDAEVSDLSRPENRFERGQGKLLEVYFPVRTKSGRPLVFEAYLRFSSIAADSRNVWSAFAPALIGGLLLLWLIQVPLAWRMARRLRAGQEEREALLVRAIEASEVERRRIAAHLHDGAVQSLAGTAYGLAAAAEENPDDARRTLRRSADEIRQAVRELRALLVDIYPPTLRREGLEAGLSDLTAPLTAQGVETTQTIPGDLDLSPDIEALFFRAAQEALRNVAKHAEASHVRIVLTVEGSVGTLIIEDDGRGIDSERTADAGRDGHFGLRLLADLARDAGGTLDVGSANGRGTRVKLELPLQ